jgi:hypothetical protein
VECVLDFFSGNEVLNRVQDDITAPFSQTSKGLMLPKVVVHNCYKWQTQ